MYKLDKSILFLKYDLICIMSHIKRLRDLKKKYQEQGGNYNMCKAIDEIQTGHFGTDFWWSMAANKSTL